MRSGQHGGDHQIVEDSCALGENAPASAGVIRYYVAFDMLMYGKHLALRGQSSIPNLAGRHRRVQRSTFSIVLTIEQGMTRVLVISH